MLNAAETGAPGIGQYRYLDAEKIVERILGMFTGVERTAERA